MNVKPETSVELVAEQIDTIRDFLTGVIAEGKPVSEHYASLDFEELKPTGDPVPADASAATFTEATLTAAIYRDMRYAHASRGRMLALGADHAMREKFELAKVLSESGQTTA